MRKTVRLLFVQVKTAEVIEMKFGKITADFTLYETGMRVKPLVEVSIL